MALILGETTVTGQSTVSTKHSEHLGWGPGSAGIEPCDARQALDLPQG